MRIHRADGVALLLLAVATAIAIVTLAATPASAATSKYLAVTKYEQNKSNWCWVAAAQTVVRYVTGTVYSQCKLFDVGRITTTGCQNVGGTRTEAQRAIGWGTGHSPDWDAGVLPAGKLATEMSAGRPLIVEIRYSATRWHMATVYGYCAGCNNTTMVSVSNLPGTVGTGTNAKIANVSLSYLSNNDEYETINYLWDIRE